MLRTPLKKLLRINELVLASAAHILKIGTIQRRLAWPLRKDDMQIREAFHIKKNNNNNLVLLIMSSADLVY